MSDSYVVKPFCSPAQGVAAVPGSKSITNRALILAALADGETLLRGALFSRDTEILITSLKQLGFAVEVNKPLHTIKVFGLGGKIPAKEAKLHVGNAGTAARFLTAFLTLSEKGKYFLDGDEAMRQRPMAGLINALRSSDNFAYDVLGKETLSFPFTLLTSGYLKNCAVDASASSQLLSALLMILPLSSGAKVLMSGSTVSEPFVQMTEKMCAQFGRPIAQINPGEWRCENPGSFISPGIYDIEPDATAASYFIALPALSGKNSCVRVNGYNPKGLQGDTAFAGVAQSCGAVLNNAGNALVINHWPEINGGTFDFNNFSDTFLTLATLACLANQPTTIKNIGHTRKQETDRVLAMATELERLGIKTQPTAKELREDDSLFALTVFPNREALKTASAQKPVPIHTYEDHRMAMSFGILGSFDLWGDGRPWIEILDPQCTGKTFPFFFSALESLRTKFVSVAIDGGAACGKSSTSRTLSEKLGFLHVDTGAHYRSLTHILLQDFVDPKDSLAVRISLSKIKLSSFISGNSAFLALNNKILGEAELRSAVVNASVSQFAAVPEVRAFILAYQRNQVGVAQQNGFAGLVMEGRDIGSVVLPHATVRIYLEADATARNQRRKDEGIVDSIVLRDKIDSSRAAAPLVCAAGAIRIDNTSLSLSEVVEQIKKIILAAGQIQ
jgi:3-phosphoshikimate 1-carboxyvinyltransferase